MSFTGAEKQKRLFFTVLLLVLFFFLNSIASAAVPNKNLNLTPEEKAWLKANPVIKVAHSSAFEPYMIKDYTGAISGIVPDYFKLIGSMLGTRVEIIDSKWNEIIPLTLEGKIDIIGGIGKIEAMNYGLPTIRPSFVNETQLYANKKRSFTINSGDDFSGLRVVYSKTNTTLKKYFSVIQDHVTVVEAESPLHGIQLLLDNKADVLIGSNIYQYLLKKFSITEIEPVFEITQKRLKTDYVIAFRPDAPLLASIVLKCLDNISNEQSLAIKSKYFYTPGKTAGFLSYEEQAWLKQNPVVRFTGDPDWLPFESFTADGEYVGIVADYINFFQKKLGIKFDKIPTSVWGESLQKALDYEVDVISESPGSIIASKFLFTKPYISSPVVLVMQSNIAHAAGGLEDFRGKRVLVVKDYGYVQDILKAYPNFPFVFVESVREGLEKVAVNEADVMVCTLALGGYMLNKLNMHNLYVGGTTEFFMKLSLAVRKDMPELFSSLNKVISRLTKRIVVKLYQSGVMVLSQKMRAGEFF